MSSVTLGYPALSAAAADKSFPSAWLAFKSRFLASDGRIVDTGNNGISHTEGQGCGMLFAHHAQDRATFDALWKWTEHTLGMAGTALHSWKYVPNSALVQMFDLADAGLCRDCISCGENGFPHFGGVFGLN